MPKNPNLLFIWTDQQAARTLAPYGNDQIEVPNLNAFAEESTVFENTYVSQPICGPSRSSIMTGNFPHKTGMTENNLMLPSDAECFPEIGDFDEYETAFIGKWHLGDEIFAQRGFDEWVGVEDRYREFYGPDRDRSEHSDYHHFLVENGFEPDEVEEDGFEWFSRDFAASLPEEYSKPAFMAQEAERFIRETDGPFILHVMFLEPHDPFTSPRDDQYDPEDVPLPPNFEHDGFEDQPLKIQLERAAQANGIGIPDYMGDNPTEDDWRELISNYWGLVSLVDTYVGEILDALENSGHSEDTIVTYTSDHGDMMGSHQLICKSVMFEESIRVPLMVDIPGVERNGGTVEHPISQVDLVPTLLDAMGQSVPESLNGESWLPFLEGEAEPPRDRVVVEWNGCSIRGQGRTYLSGAGEASVLRNPDPTTPHPDYMSVWGDMASDTEIMTAMTEAVRTIITPDGWKLNYRHSGEKELYDLDEDPYETQDLSEDGSYAEKVDELTSEIIDWQVETLDPVHYYRG